MTTPPVLTKIKWREQDHWPQGQVQGRKYKAKAKDLIFKANATNYRKKLSTALHYENQMI